MNRNIFEKIIEWDNQYNGKALLLSGAPGTGKTYLALELAKNFHNSYLYLNPQNDAKLKNALFEMISTENCDFSSFLQQYFRIPAEWLSEFLIILDDFDYYSEFIQLIVQITSQTLPYRLLILLTAHPNNILSQQCEVQEIGPLSFDEYLKAIGSEWYTEIIRAHYQTKKKIPEIVHKEMLSLFRDFLRIGGMPAAVNEYLHTESLNNVSSVHRHLHEISLARFSRYSESSRVRLMQLMAQVPGQLIKDNKNYRYNMIRKGATHNMYRAELQMLTDLHLVNKLERADILRDGKEYHLQCHENQFRLYPSDSGLLYSQIMSESCDFSDETDDENMDYSAEHLYQLLAEAYLLQTLSAKTKQTVFWESGSLSKIDFITMYDKCILPIELKFNENKRSKSMHVFCQKHEIESHIKFGLHNFDTTQQYTACPIYSLFCL